MPSSSSSSSSSPACEGGGSVAYVPLYFRFALLSTRLSFSNGNCDVCGVLTDDFEKHFQLHLVKVEDKLEVKVEVNVEEKVAVDEAKEFNEIGVLKI